MAKTANMYIRIDPEVKHDVEKIYAQYGVSLSEAITMFLYQSRNIGGFPFDLKPSEKRTYGTTGGVKGILNKYANPSLRINEKSAWAEAAEEKHGNP